ncbi:DUF5320 domain-containing protein [Labilibaculum antarcticum]|uniref:Uncharacterized protein n=1 Tax=Labilibaculum antarcticum TaxID=1717717 RepID=A0A1Y1CM07_9BACT|nr:DUF5320 domain-containing protein [Labilibaculum antarcticum]BAX81458.1 hypothetical protein ALGA_3158 [Labilibaculum antarcticum]
MPGFNQTGPMGQGPMTGRRMGRCANVETNPENQTTESKENTNDNTPENFQGRGFGFGRGRGRGRRGFGMGRQNGFRGGF